MPDKDETSVWDINNKMSYGEANWMLTPLGSMLDYFDGTYQAEAFGSITAEQHRRRESTWRKENPEWNGVKQIVQTPSGALRDRSYNPITDSVLDQSDIRNVFVKFPGIEDKLRSAQTPEDARYIWYKYATRYQREQRVDSEGTLGTLGWFGAQVLADPTNILPIHMGIKVINQAAHATRFVNGVRRIGNAAPPSVRKAAQKIIDNPAAITLGDAMKVSGLAGTASLGVEYLFNETMEPEDVLVGGAISAVVAAPLIGGAFALGAARNKLGDAVNRFWGGISRDISDSGKPLTEPETLDEVQQGISHILERAARGEQPEVYTRNLMRYTAKIDAAVGLGMTRGSISDLQLHESPSVRALYSLLGRETRLVQHAADEMPVVALSSKHQARNREIMDLSSRATSLLHVNMDKIPGDDKANAFFKVIIEVLDEGDERLDFHIENGTIPESMRADVLDVVQGHRDYFNFYGERADQNLPVAERKENYFPLTNRDLKKVLNEDNRIKFLKDVADYYQETKGVSKEEADQMALADYNAILGGASESGDSSRGEGFRLSKDGDSIESDYFVEGTTTPGSARERLIDLPYRLQSQFFDTATEFYISRMRHSLAVNNFVDMASMAPEGTAKLTPQKMEKPGDDVDISQENYADTLNDNNGMFAATVKGGTRPLEYHESVVKPAGEAVRTSRSALDEAEEALQDAVSALPEEKQRLAQEAYDKDLQIERLEEGGYDPDTDTDFLGLNDYQYTVDQVDAEVGNKLSMFEGDLKYKEDLLQERIDAGEAVPNIPRKELEKQKNRVMGEINKIGDKVAKRHQRNFEKLNDRLKLAEENLAADEAMVRLASWRKGGKKYSDEYTKEMFNADRALIESRSPKILNAILRSKPGDAAAQVSRYETQVELSKKRLSEAQDRVDNMPKTNPTAKESEAIKNLEQEYRDLNGTVSSEDVKWRSRADQSLAAKIARLRKLLKSWRTNPGNPPEEVLAYLDNADVKIRIDGQFVSVRDALASKSEAQAQVADIGNQINSLVAERDGVLTQLGVVKGPGSKEAADIMLLREQRNVMRRQYSDTKKDWRSATGFAWKDKRVKFDQAAKAAEEQRQKVLLRTASLGIVKVGDRWDFRNDNSVGGTVFREYEQKIAEAPDEKAKEKLIRDRQRVAQDMAQLRDYYLGIEYGPDGVMMQTAQMLISMSNMGLTGPTIFANTMYDFSVMAAKGQNMPQFLEVAAKTFTDNKALKDTFSKLPKFSKPERDVLKEDFAQIIDAVELEEINVQNRGAGKVELDQETGDILAENPKRLPVKIKDFFGRVYNVISGNKYSHTAMMKGSASVAASRIIDIAEKKVLGMDLRTDEIDLIKRAGLTDDMVEVIFDQWVLHNGENWITPSGLRLATPGMWKDKNAAQVFKRAADTIGKEISIKPHREDMPQAGPLADGLLGTRNKFAAALFNSLQSFISHAGKVLRDRGIQRIPIDTAFTNRVLGKQQVGDGPKLLGAIPAYDAVDYTLRASRATAVAAGVYGLLEVAGEFGDLVMDEIGFERASEKPEYSKIETQSELMMHLIQRTGVLGRAEKFYSMAKYNPVLDYWFNNKSSYGMKADLMLTAANMVSPAIVNNPIMQGVIAGTELSHMFGGNKKPTQSEIEFFMEKHLRVRGIFSPLLGISHAINDIANLKDEIRVRVAD